MAFGREPDRHGYATAEGYVGPDLHRAARVTAAAHGGQVLLSQATRQLVPDVLDGLTFRDLGERRLKDLSRPQRLHQLCVPGLPTEVSAPADAGGQTDQSPRPANAARRPGAHGRIVRFRRCGGPGRTSTGTGGRGPPPPRAARRRSVRVPSRSGSGRQQADASPSLGQLFRARCSSTPSLAPRPRRRSRHSSAARTPSASSRTSGATTRPSRAPLRRPSAP